MNLLPFLISNMFYTDNPKNREKSINILLKSHNVRFGMKNYPFYFVSTHGINCKILQKLMNKNPKESYLF